MTFSDIDPRYMNLGSAMQLSDEHKQLYFERSRIGHIRIRKNLKDFESMAAQNTGTDLILLTGPTGVGKSTLITYIWDKLINKYKQEMIEDPGMAPCVVISAPASGERTFSWRAFYTRIGTALSEPLLDRKQTTVPSSDRLFVSGSSRGCTVASLQHAIEKLLIARRTQLLIIDEAIPLVRNNTSNMLDTHMDTLKSLSNICGLTVAMVGSYDLMHLMSLSGQLARRSTVLHFQRYHMGVAEDEKAFARTIQSLQKTLPIKNMPDLTKLSNELHLATHGCVGILKDTFAKLLKISLDCDGTWREEFLKTALLSKKSWESILQETIEGEKKIQNMEFGPTDFDEYKKLQTSLLEVTVCG